MHLKLEDMQAFVAVTELQSFSKAADRLRITQSALSRRIRKMEHLLGARLLDRTTRKVSASVVGAEFLPEAQRIVGEVERSLSFIGDVIQMRSGTVSIASNMTISDTLLPEILERFRTAHPDVLVRVSEGSSPGAVRRVLDRSAEFAMAQFGEGHPDLEFEPIFEDRFVVVSHRDHPLAGLPGLTWDALESENFIRMRAGSGTTNLLRRSLRPRFDRLSGDIEVGHFNALLAMTARNLGVSVIPTLARQKRVDLDLAMMPIREPVISRSLGIVTHRGRSLSPAAEAMRATCRRILSRIDGAVKQVAN